MINRQNVLVVGVDFQTEFQLKKWWSLIGRKPEADNEAIVGAEAKNKLNAHLYQTIEVNGKILRVVGILEPTGSQDDDIVFIDLRQSQSLFGKTSQLSLIEVAALCYDCPIEEIVRQTSEKLPNARVMAIRQTIESKMEAIDRFSQFSLGISVVVLFVGALIVFTNVSSSVNERTREIGIFRAVGFRQSHIMEVILFEVLLTSFLAGLVGYFLGLGVSRFVAPMLSTNGGEEITMSYLLLITAVALAVSVGLASSVYPAYRTSRLDPTVALRAL
jgi:putative ABC transport system permease protein